MTGEAHERKRTRRVLIVLFATLLIDTIGFGMIFPIIPIIFTDPSSPSFLLGGASRETQFFLAGAIAAVFGFMQFVASPILGELSDVFGRKRLLMIGVGVLAFSQLIFGFGIEVGSVLLLFVARIVAGIAAANFAVAQAAIADVTHPSERAKNFGLIGGAFGVGFIVGPLLGGWLAAVSGDPAVPFWVASALGVLNLISVSLFLTETRHVERKVHSFTLLKGLENIRTAFNDVDARPFYFANFLYVSGFVFFNTFIGVLLVSSLGFTEGSVGTFFGAAGFFVVVTQLIILRILAKRFGERAIIRRSIPIVALVMFLFPFAPSASAAYGLLALFAISHGLTMANTTALVSKGVSAEKQGAALGVNGSVIALAQGIIPLVAGFGASAVGVSMPFIAGGVLMLGAWYVLFGMMRGGGA